MPDAVLVLGIDETRPNLGTVIMNELEFRGYVVEGHDCSSPDGVYRIPPAKFEQFEAMVVTLGHTRMVPFTEVEEDDLAEVIRACLTLPLMAVKAFVQEREGKGGTVVLLGSYAHDHPLTYGAAYCAAKAGLAAAVKELAWELTEWGFFIHIIHPYHVPSTPMGKRVVHNLMTARGMTEEQAEAYQRKDLKMPEHLTPEDVGEVVYWLLSQPAARWTAGSGINLYGGTR